MAKRQLKVFRTQLGFDEVIVAAPSQAKALKAWDVRQNLFAEKMASLFRGEAAGAALKQPGKLFRRPVGSSEPFTEQSQLPASRSPGKVAGHKSVKVASQTEKAQSRADVSALDKAEKALIAVNEQAAAALTTLTVERRELDERERDVRAAAEKARAKAEATVEKAKRAFMKAGGTF